MAPESGRDSRGRPFAPPLEPCVREYARRDFDNRDVGNNNATDACAGVARKACPRTINLRGGGVPFPLSPLPNDRPRPTFLSVVLVALFGNARATNGHGLMMRGQLTVGCEALNLVMKVRVLPSQPFDSGRLRGLAQGRLSHLAIGITPCGGVAYECARPAENRQVWVRLPPPPPSSRLLTAEDAWLQPGDGGSTPSRLDQTSEVVVQQEDAGLANRKCGCDSRRLHHSSPPWSNGRAPAWCGCRPDPTSSRVARPSSGTSLFHPQCRKRGFDSPRRLHH